MRDLAGLIERLEKLDGPDREVDAWIGNEVEPTTFRWERNYGPLAAHTYTASLDAAIALTEKVLPGWGFYLRSDKEGHGCGLVYPDAFRVTPCHCMGATPAIALVLALLRALQSTGGQS